jgi:multicomponent Na+:H+ antiporter subunit B
MSRRARLTLFGAAAAGLATLLLWSITGLPKFGDYHGAYGRILNQAAPKERQSSNVVAAVTFDYRGFDTMGEELILFAAVMGVAMLLREPREEEAPVPEDPVRSDALRAFGIAFAGATLVLALWIIAHGYITPGGGFQGGVILASAFLLVWLAGSYRSYRRLTPIPLLGLGEGAGVGGYIVIGLSALLIGDAFLHNLLPYGVAGKLSSGGTIPLLNWAAALEVTAAFILLFNEFLSERAILIDTTRRRT